MKTLYCTSLIFFLLLSSLHAELKPRVIQNFDRNWKFNLGDIVDGQDPALSDTGWRTLNLPHDWSIEGTFSEDNPATPGGGALPGGIGWYRKTFTVSETNKNKLTFIQFDGVYRNSEVWINGHPLGKRPYGYSSFQYELTPYLKYGDEKNALVVRVDNSQQPNSRWYSGSGIYRNVWLVFTHKIAVDHWGTCITTSDVCDTSARVNVVTKVNNRSGKKQEIVLTTRILNAHEKEVARTTEKRILPKDFVREIKQDLKVQNPVLWSLENPSVYTAVTQIVCGKEICDTYETTFGIRYFAFDREKGFFLNGKPLKILGVCDHHDLGCLGAAINTRALQRQLEILKSFGCNAIRTSHNPPAPELLDLCDHMGFIVMDEAFDMWKKGKTKFDYHLEWDQWHKRDLEDMVLRDRNHPSIFLWSIGNEIWEQGDSAGAQIAWDLRNIVRSLDTTRPITSACNDGSANNFIIKSNALDVVGINYNQQLYADLPTLFPGKTFIGSETTSALATRGSYDMPSDSIRRWPDEKGKMNADYSCSAYDNCSAAWGETNEEAWLSIKKYDFLSGMFIWTGFDYLGEPTPYSWPARSSYFGIVDLCGFPKDAFYLYQSEWTDKPVLHIFPHWNWKEGDTIDVVAYTSGDEMELFLNTASLGVRKKTDDVLHLTWRVPYTPGTLLGIAKKNGKEIAREEVKTAGQPAAILLAVDHNKIKADGSDLAFVTVKIVDSNGVTVPYADNTVHFQIQGEGFIAGVDNGSPISHESFKARSRKAFHGLCLAVIQSNGMKGTITVKAASEGLEPTTVKIEAE